MEKTMKYPIAIESGDGHHAWGVVVPDLPGCFSAADSGLDEAIENAKEAITVWIEAVMDDGMVAMSPLRLVSRRIAPSPSLKVGFGRWRKWTRRFSTIRPKG